MFVNILATIITTLAIGACSDQNSAFNASTSSRKKRPVEDELGAFGETFEEAEEKEKEKECQEGNQGRIIVSHDEWAFSNTGFDEAPDAEIFIKNITNWLRTCGKTSNNKFHALSTDFSLNESSLANIMRENSYSYTQGTNEDLAVENLKKYDWIYLAGKVRDVNSSTLNQALKNYVDQGGNVYISAGTNAWGSAEGEAAFFNPFLANYGLRYEPRENDINKSLNPNSDHPIFANVSSLYYNNGNSVSLTGGNDKARIVSVHAGQGLFGIFDGRLAD